MKNILVAIDPDDRTMELIRYSKEFAKKFGAKIWIVHIAAPDPDFVGYEAGPQYTREFRASELREDHRKLQELSNQLKQDGVDAESLLIQGPTVQSLLDEAKKLSIDLMIIGSHDHSFLYNIFVGNTSLQLLRKSRIPLLAVPID